MLSNFFIIFLILISFTKFAFGNEPTDIWSLEKKEKSSEENTIIENSSSEVENKKPKLMLVLLMTLRLRKKFLLTKMITKITITFITILSGFIELPMLVFL